MNGSIAPSSAFRPIPKLHREDGDVSIYFLSGNGVIFMAPTTDPWYKATTPGPKAREVSTVGECTVYVADEAASPIACVARYQLCRGGASPASGNSKCGPLAGFMDAAIGAAPLFDFPGELDAIFSGNVSGTETASAFNWFTSIWRVMNPEPYFIFNTLGSSSLDSKRRYRAGVQGPLPSDQWQNDLTHMWNVTLASFQESFVSTAQGTSQRDIQQYLRRPSTQYQKQLCASQVRDQQIDSILYQAILLGISNLTLNQRRKSGAVDLDLSRFLVSVLPIRLDSSSLPSHMPSNQLSVGASIAVNEHHEMVAVAELMPKR